MYSCDVGERQSFVETTSKLMEKVVEMIANATSMEEVLGNEPDCVFLKSAEGTVLYSNRACQEIFSKECLLVGRRAESLISKSIAQFAKWSDGLIMSGCGHIMVDHLGHNGNGERIRLSTAKYSLLGYGHPAIAILGITRIHEVLADSSDRRIQVNALAEKWSRFQRLNSSKRDIAVQLVQGMNMQQIADLRDVSRRTIENHRGSILKELGVANPIELAKLLVRFQVSGFGDLKLE